MKNIQVIDGAENCTYSIFRASDEDFSTIFPDENDVEFADDFVERVGDERGIEISNRLWKQPVDKKIVSGIHGTLFYELPEKKRFYPTKKEAEMVPLGVDGL
jgi:hypothetical protein